MRLLTLLLAFIGVAATSGVNLVTPSVAQLSSFQPKLFGLGGCSAGDGGPRALATALNITNYNPIDIKNSNWAIKVLSLQQNVAQLQIVCKSGAADCTASNLHPNIGPSHFYIAANVATPELKTRCVNNMNPAQGQSPAIKRDFISVQSKISSSSNFVDFSDVMLGRWSGITLGSQNFYHIYKFGAKADLKVGQIIKITFKDSFTSAAACLDVTNSNSKIYYSFMKANDDLTIAGKPFTFSHAFCPIDSVSMTTQ